MTFRPTLKNLLRIITTIKGSYLSSRKILSWGFLKDAQKIAKTVEGVGHTFHGFGKIPAEKCKKIDFVFVTPQIQVERSFIPANVEGQPGKNLSDHNPQIVKVSF